MSATPKTSSDRHDRTRSRPGAVVAAAALLGLQAVAWTVLAVVEALSTRGFRAEVGIGSAILMAAYAVVLLVVARGLARVRRWARGPAVATQVIQLPVAYSFLGGPTVWVAVVLGTVSLAVLGCVLSPPATRVLAPGAD